MFVSLAFSSLSLSRSSALPLCRERFLIPQQRVRVGTCPSFSVALDIFLPVPAAPRVALDRPKPAFDRSSKTSFSRLLVLPCYSTGVPRSAYAALSSCLV